jgi:murein DD-endopeptidase MepM/ murein hydrolase activator NlpD
MIIPGKKGRTLNVAFGKIAIMLTIFLISSFAIIIALFISLYFKSLHDEARARKTITELNLINKNYKTEIETLVLENKAQTEIIEALNEESESIKTTLIELQELEAKVRSLMNNSGTSLNPSRGGVSLNSSLTQEVKKSIESFSDLIVQLDNYNAQQRRLPLMLPCIGQVTSYFGYRSNPFGRGSREFHSGIDIANSQGTPIYSSGDGTVTYSGWLGNYGNTIIINHGNGYESLYAHNSKLLVSANTSVKRGDKIALMGSTGRSTGPHCHFEVRYNSKPINPFNLIKGGT